MAGELYLPVAFKPPIWITNLAAYSRASQLAASAKALGDLSQIAGGRSGKPRDPVVIVGPDGQTPIMIAGMGFTEAAEIEEIGLAAIEKAEQNIKESGDAFKLDQWREDNGLCPRDEFDAHYKQALRDRAESHRRNPISDPEKPMYSRRVGVRGQSMVALPTNPLAEKTDGN